MNGKIVISGASGQYGRMATDMLIEKGLADRLILITRTPAKLADRAAQGCDVRYGDYDKPETLAEAVKGAEKMLLISGTRVGARVVQHKAAIDAAAAAGLKHIAYTSFIGIDDPKNPAEVRHDHIETEHLMRASGMAWTALRDAHYADAMILMAGPQVMATGKWFSNSGDGREAMVWRDDCVASAVAVLTTPGHEGKIYNITGPDLQTFDEVAAIITEVTGVPIEHVKLDDDGQYAMFDAMGIPRRPVDDQSVNGIPWNSDDMVTFGQAIREGYLAVASDDVERLTGRKARSVRKMIEDNRHMLIAAARSAQQPAMGANP
ncbi:MAG: SDR family oxidoreductase [Sphingobium sp.]|nr:SDR family oxidoreductase [Sphingobium sp.]